MRRNKAVKDALKKDRSDEQREPQLMGDLAGLEGGIADPAQRATSLMQLKDRLTDLSRKSEAATDPADRRMARRVLRASLMGAAERVRDPEYRKLLDKYRPASRP